jgi:hypothetical protein
MRPQAERWFHPFELPDAVGPVTVGLYGGFTVAAGTLLAGGMLAFDAADPGVGRRATALALLAVPLWTVLFTALAQDAPLRPGGTLDPRPGVVETWSLLAAAVGAVAYLYWPVVDPLPGDGAALLVPLSFAAYLLAPGWLGARLLGGLSNGADVAVAAMSLSLLAVAAGAALTVPGGPADARLYASLGGAGVAVVTYLAAAGGDGAAADGD